MAVSSGKILRKLSVLFLLGSFSAYSQTARVSPCRSAVASPCSVTGVLTLRRVYGPPWFGENGDKTKFTIYVIRLHTPIHFDCIADHKSDPVKDCGLTKDIQIFAQDSVASENDLRRLAGHEVVAIGTTSEPVAPMEHEPTMDLVSLEPSRKQLKHKSRIADLDGNR